jgi:hypothetical protein
MSDEDAWLNRYSILVAFSVLLLLITGATVTSLERPISPVPSAPTTPAAVSFESWHRLGAVFVAVLVGGLTVWFARVSKESQLRQGGWIVVSVFVVIVLLSLLIVCLFLVRQFAEQPSLRPAAVALVVHVATGALTLAASVSLAAEVRRNAADVRLLTGQ